MVCFDDGCVSFSFARLDGNKESLFGGDELVKMNEKKI